MNKTKLFVIFAAVLVLLFLTGSYRLYEIQGGSDAPTILLNDRVIVNKLAYDAVLPFTFKKLWTRKNPQRGDLILCTILQKKNAIKAVKRITALPNDTFQISEKKVIINGDTLHYEILNRNNFDAIPTRNKLGNVIAIENDGHTGHLVSWTQEDSTALNFGPITLKKDEYFLLGDNRDNSLDSRHFGPVKRDKIHGKLIHIFNTGSRVKGE
jgi:signal peptidase I